ncbi:hypothetical protein [Amycolatopsis dongchuanensis]|uniref:Uncharacterized protein n=1 Tax=Amycolatopsis dongchuanensis TaxID=1070866 RepID=A0ABP8VDR4_9PSEU
MATAATYTPGPTPRANPGQADPRGLDRRDLRAEAVDGFDDVTERHILGDPAHTVASGHSLEGLVAAALAQRAPEAIGAAVPMCASVAGPIPMLNQGLDAAFVFARLCFPEEDIELADVTVEDTRRLAIGRALVERARHTREGRARPALASAVAQIPTWSTDNALSSRSAAAHPEPAPDDITGRLANQADVFPCVAFSPRLDLERRAGGNFSWNTGIDYAVQLARSGSADLVRAAYDREGCVLEDDLDRLQESPASRRTATPSHTWNAISRRTARSVSRC